MDQYSLLHFAMGIVVYFFNISFMNWFILHGLFELTENTQIGMNIINNYFGKIWPGGKDFADAPINSIGDQVFAMLGWIVAYICDIVGNKYGVFRNKLSYN